MPRDAWIALVVAAASAISLWDLWRTPASGAFVKATSFPIALSAIMLGLSSLLFTVTLLRRTAKRRAPPDPARRGAAVRVVVLFVLTVIYVAALPWTGYLLTSALYFGALSLQFGNRQPVSILITMVVVPLALLLFFEKYMIVLLPSAQLLW